MLHDSLKIGIDASRANRKHKTGTEWYSYYLIQNLAKIDSKNQYILYTDKPLTGSLCNLCDEEEIEIEFDKEGFQIIKSPYNNFRAKVLRWPFGFFWTLGRMSLEMLFKKPDVLFVPSHALPLITPKKTINTIHDIAFIREDQVYDKDKVNSEIKIMKKVVNFFVQIITLKKYSANSRDYLKWSTKFSLKKASQIIAVSNFTKEELKEVYGKKYSKKIEVVYNGYSKFNCDDLDKEKTEEILAGYGIEKPYFLYVGRLEKKKNTPLLIEAFAKFKENKKRKEKLVLIGIPGFGYDEVRYMIREYDLVDDVIIPGWIEEADMGYIHHLAEAFVFPSRHEGFGLPVLQAMNCKIPVIASDIPALREVAKDGALFFDVNDKKSLAKAMNDILSKDIQEKLKEKGKKIAEEYSWEKCAKDTLKVLNRK